MINIGKITIVEAMTGSGKTTWAIQHMCRNRNTNFMYITPFLTEVERIIKDTKGSKSFVQPVNNGSGKLASLNRSISNEDDIASTHELFKHLDEESKKLLQFGHYTLILDEVLDVIVPYSIKKGDLQLLQDGKWLSVGADGFLEWNDEIPDYDNSFEEIKLLSENHSLMLVNQKILLWRYPPEIFGMFDEIYILTYMFDASILKHYFDYYGIQYDRASIKADTNGEYQLCRYIKQDVTKYRKLINIYDGELNESFAQKKSCMSKNWFRNSENKKKIQKIKNNLYNYFQHQIHAKSDTIMWTTFKDFSKKLSGKGYSKGFLSFNCRSTNDYADKYNLAYAINIYLNPGIPDFFEQKNIKFDQNAYALSEMIQWVWRSRIRKGEPINIYIPVKRMRELFKKWLNGEPIPVFYG